jgi:hypothetical protein
MSITDSQGHVVALPREREPFQVCALAVSLLYAVVGTAAYERLAATSIRLFPFSGGRVFLILLGVGALTALAGLYTRSLRGMRVEMAGLTLLVSLCFSYVLWTPFSVGLRGLGLMLYMGVLIMVPAAIRVRRLRGQIKAAEEALGDARRTRPTGAADA